MKTSRRDQNAIYALLFENDLAFDDSGFSAEDPSFGGEPEQEVVVDIAEPVGPVQPDFGGEDELYEEVKGDLKKLVEFSGRLQQICKPGGSLKPWMLAKIARAADYITDIAFQLDDAADFANTGFEQAGPEQGI